MIDRYPLDLTNKRYSILFIRRGIYFESCKSVDYIKGYILKGINISDFAAKNDMSPERYMSLKTQKIIRENQYIMRTLFKNLKTNRFEMGI